RDHLTHTREQLAAAQAQDRMRAYQAGTQRTLCLLNTTTDLEDHLPEGLRVCEETLRLYGILESSDWENQADWQHLSTDERQSLAEDTRELLMMLAWARVRLAGGKRPGLEQALELLDRAQAIGGLAPSRALWEALAVC